ncbi:MAG: 6-bladed beta-propeller, partial [Nitrospirae bacterium]|nr:6-bladed beta-propeller [Nitrospirota bacterium]
MIKRHLLLLTIFMMAFIGSISPVFGEEYQGGSSMGPEPYSFIAPDGESYVFDLKWGSYGTLNDEFNQPHGVTVDQAGDIWVTDNVNDRIVKFDSSGNFLLTIGSTGTGPGQLNAPEGIDVDSAGNIWVADYSNGRVQKLNSLGQQICQVAGLSGPEGVAVDHNTGNVFISNIGTEYITKVDSTCAIIGGWGGYGSGNGQFYNPYGVAVDMDGNVYVADYSNHRVQKFDGNGIFITKWGVSGSGDSRFALSAQFNGPIGIGVDAAGDVVVVDHNNHRIQKFNSNGTFITAWGWYGAGNGQFNLPWGVATDGQGRVYIADRDNHRVQRFFPSNTAETQLYKRDWGNGGSANGQFNNPVGTVTDSFGNVYVVDNVNHRVQKFDPNGMFILKWGKSGTGNGQFRYPVGIAIDNTGNIYIADRDNHRIQKFDSTGVFLMGMGNCTVWSAPAPAPAPASGTGNGCFKQANDVAVDPTTGDIYVADMSNHRIQKFNSAGIFIMGIGNGTTWTGIPPAPASGNLNRWFNVAHALTLDSAGNIYIS